MIRQRSRPGLATYDAIMREHARIEAQGTRLANWLALIALVAFFAAWVLL